MKKIFLAVIIASTFLLLASPVAAVMCGVLPKTWQCMPFYKCGNKYMQCISTISPNPQPTSYASPTPTSTPQPNYKKCLSGSASNPADTYYLATPSGNYYYATGASRGYFAARTYQGWYETFNFCPNYPNCPNPVPTSGCSTGRAMHFCFKKPIGATAR